MTNKYRIIQIGEKYYVQIKKKGIFGKWKKFDYHYTKNDAEIQYEKLLTSGKVYCESKWITY